MRKYRVHFKSWTCPAGSYIHIFATSAEEAKQSVMADGVGYCNGRVYPDEITGVEEVN